MFTSYKTEENGLFKDAAGKFNDELWIQAFTFGRCDQMSDISNIDIRIQYRNGRETIL